MDKSPDEIAEEQSERVFWVVQTTFAFVLARSFIEYRESILDPFSQNHWNAALGLVLVYSTALLSWIDYSFMSIVAPYNLGRGVYEKARFLVDLIIVGCYSILLFSAEKLQDDPSANIGALFVILVVVFSLYAASGKLRIIQHGKRSSSLGLIFKFLAAFFVLAIAYHLAFACLPAYHSLLNFFAMSAALGLMLSYRWVRAHTRRRSLWIGIDVDGVLADQITGILPLATAKSGKAYVYDDITQWDLPVGDSNIAEIIKEEQSRNKRYIESMTLHVGAVEALDELISKYRVAIVTARDPSTDTWTKAWLKKNGVPCDHYENKKEGTKQNADTDIRLLVDDYPGNVSEFLRVPGHKAVLFSQPWNRGHGLQAEVDSGRLIVASNWNEVVAAIRTLTAVPAS